MIELLTPEAEWLPVTRVTPVTSCLYLMRKMFLIIYIYIIKLLYIAQFPKINTRGVTAVTEVTEDTKGY